MWWFDGRPGGRCKDFGEMSWDGTNFRLPIRLMIELYEEMAFCSTFWKDDASRLPRRTEPTTLIVVDQSDDTMAKRTTRCSDPLFALCR